MSHYCLNASTPQHIYGYVDKAILHNESEPMEEYEPCIIFGVTSIPSRALHFSILCESGAQWARIPIHMLRHEKQSAFKSKRITHDITNLQMWDNHGWDFSVVQYEFLREMGCEYINKENIKIPARYWFTLDHTDNGYSQYPSQHKCYHLLLLEDGSGQIAAQPNNRILWKDHSFVKAPDKITYKVMGPKTWHCEIGKSADETAFTK
jgi:hypothetical protein